MRLTEDDIAIIRAVAKHRFLRSTHILRLMPGRPPKKLIERLGSLYHNSYLDRPRAQLDYYATAGSAPMVYALGNRGADVLAELDGLHRGRIDWTWKNRSAGRTFLQHTLLTADVLVAAEAVRHTRSDVEIMAPETILVRAPEATRSLRNPFHLSAKVQHAGAIRTLGLVPDAVFGLDFTQARKRSYFFLEADRATMPIRRVRLDQTSILRKLMTYLAGGGANNAFGRHLGLGNFRVLFVTTSEARAAGMIEALESATGGTGSRQFLFTTRGALERASDLLDVTWVSGKREIVRLGD
jgi:hypothetical protein